MEILIGEGAIGVSPPRVAEIAALPQWKIYKKILAPFSWTESTIFFHPSTCSSV
jgi:hypothetical protein